MVTATPKSPAKSKSPARRRTRSFRERNAPLVELLNRLMPDPAAGQPSAQGHNGSQIAEELGRQEIDYMFSETFASPEEVEDILTAVSIAETPAASLWKPGREMPAHLARMCEASLLKPAEERNLFRRMNFAKYRADLLRRELDPRSPDGELIALIEKLQLLALWDRNRIVRANLRLVVSIAKKFADQRNGFDDLLSEGITSLLRAVEKFDFGRGFRFSTYATQAVRRTLCRLVQTSQRDRTRFMHAEPGLLEETPEDDSSATLSEARWIELRRALGRLLAKLDPRERAIVRFRFGLERDQQVHTLQSLAGEMGVCKERVRQLEMRAITKLRTMAEAVRLAPPEEE
jgi:RNA polymerase primary sigma factor